MEAIQDELCIGAMFFNGIDEGFAHVAASPGKLFFLVVAERLFEEPVDGLTGLALTDPKNPRAVKVVNDSDVLVPFAVGDLIDADGFEPSNSVAIAYARDRAMEDVGKRGRRHTEQLRCRPLCHQLGVGEHQVLDAIGDTGSLFGPGDRFLYPAMCRAHDLFWAVQKEYGPPANPYVPPHPGLGQNVYDVSATFTLGTPASVLVGFDRQEQLLGPFLECDVIDLQVFEFEQLPDSFVCSDRLPPWVMLDEEGPITISSIFLKKTGDWSSLRMRHHKEKEAVDSAGAAGRYGQTVDG